jgi:hypothetical protein
VTAAKPLHTTCGVDLYDDGLGGLKAYRGHQFVGAAFPSVVPEPSGSWFGRRRGEPARRFDSRQAALAYLVGPRRVRVLGDLYHGRIPDGAVYVGRAAPGLPPSPYANPHKIGKPCRLCRVEHDRVGAVDAYRRALMQQPDLLAAARRDLAGRDLACWCRTDDLCHADVLIILVSEGVQQ